MPLFEARDDGLLTGLGTAFGVSPKGILLTADHVIASYRDSCVRLNTNSLSPTFGPSGDRSLIAFLSPGVVFGTVHIPHQFFPLILSAHSPTKEGDDPMRELRGEANIQTADVSVLRTQELKQELHTFRVSAASPKVGDTVVAIGFPKLDLIQGGRQEVAALLEEEMFASYGTVTALHPNGRDRSNQTPVFEVEAHWPSGMSGGPVLNRDGHVVGVVSRSMEGTEDFAGCGWATWLARLPELANAVPLLP
ncbi:serine protease [Pseudotabrizicola sp. 4114]|uniref:S1 family peptidase n=1 Tax=Pseudotabrizicola sp. 4114 TaxID=2817731 RepID=UPI002867A298|nr:S1-C subfamily serine protease [Pseudorhodobacter sp. 4114]